MAFQEMKISQVVIIVYGADGYAKEHWLKGKPQYSWPPNYNLFCKK